MAAERQGALAGVLLAAGQSTRMGQNKLLLRLGGDTLVRRAALAALSAGLEPLIVVLGHERERVQAELAGLACTPVFNEEFALGQSTSLRRGFQAVPDQCAGAIALLADMPFVSAAELRNLVERWRASSAPLAISTYDGVVAPPQLYGRALFAELRALAADGRGRQLIQAHRGQALEVAQPASALADLDVPADVERARSAIERAPA